MAEALETTILKTTLELFTSNPTFWEPHDFMNALAFAASQHHASALHCFDTIYQVITPCKSIVDWQSQERTRQEVKEMLEHAIRLSERRTR